MKPTQTSVKGKKELPALPKDLILPDEAQKSFYLSLSRLNLSQAAKEIGLADRYKTESSLRAIAFRLYKSIDPRALGISEDAIRLVKEAIDGRKSASKDILMHQANADALPEVLDPEDTKKLIDGGKNKAILLLHKKFDRLGRSNKMLDAVPLSQLATTMGILFDKSQILRGEATENIAVMAKVDANMSPEERLQALLKMREVQQEDKHSDK